MSHTAYMRYALSLARRNVGQTWPNPSVGAVIVKDGRIVGTGYTNRGGRPHAETEALAQAGNEAEGADMYISLEPCAHQGKTPPCTDAIIKAGIKRCVIACTDPNPAARGGIAKLRQAGIEIIENICKEEALGLNRGFFSLVEKKRPFIALKLATSQDGKIATASGESKWITGEHARMFGHKLRSQFDAIATGIGTALADDPLLTCRLPGLEDRSPVRILFDRKNRLPDNSQLAKTANQVPLWKLSHNSISEAVQHIGDQGITRLLVEAGQTLSTAFLQSGLVDRIYWFRSQTIIGNDGLAAIEGGFPQQLSALTQWRLREQISLHPDNLDILECSPAS